MCADTLDCAAGEECTGNKCQCTVASAKEKGVDSCAQGACDPVSKRCVGLACSSHALCDTGKCLCAGDWARCVSDKPPLGPFVKREGEGVGSPCTQLGIDARNCARCGDDCTALDNVLGSSTCTEKVCQIQCKPGYADADKNPSNGCEIELGTDTNCSKAGDNCAAYTNETNHAEFKCEPVDEKCTSDACAKACAFWRCKPGSGYADGDKDPSNGCELPLGTNTDCGPNCGGCSNSCGDTEKCVNEECQ